MLAYITATTAFVRLLRLNNGTGGDEIISTGKKRVWSLNVL